MNYKEDFDNTTHLRQASQTFPLQFQLCLIEEDLCTIKTQPFQCREYLNDTAVSINTGLKGNIYGWHLNNPAPYNGLLLSKSPYNKKVQQNKEILLEAMKTMGIEGSFVDEYLLKFDTSVWEHPLKIQLLTYLIKVLCQQKVTSLKDAFDNLSGNEHDILYKYKISQEDIYTGMELVPLLKSFDYMTVSSYHTSHTWGVGFFLGKVIQSPYKKQVEEALQQLNKNKEKTNALPIM